MSKVFGIVVFADLEIKTEVKKKIQGGGKVRGLFV